MSSTRQDIEANENTPIQQFESHLFALEAWMKEKGRHFANGVVAGTFVSSLTHAGCMYVIKPDDKIFAGCMSTFTAAICSFTSAACKDYYPAPLGLFISGIATPLVITGLTYGGLPEWVPPIVAGSAVITVVGQKIAPKVGIGFSKFFNLFRPSNENNQNDNHIELNTRGRSLTRPGRI